MTPYTTKSGLRIGSRYEPPRRNLNSPEDEYWQSVLLGRHPGRSHFQTILFGAYLVLLVLVFGILWGVL